MASLTQNSPSPFRLPANFDYKRQSIALPGTKKPGQTGTHHHHCRRDNFVFRPSFFSYLQTWYPTFLTLSSIPFLSDFLLSAAYPSLIDFNTKGVIPNPVDIFQTALSRYSTQSCLGYRQLISKNPLKFAPTYTWVTYSEVDQKRRKIGSALEYLWEQRRIGGSDLRTVGIWSQNRIGITFFCAWLTYPNFNACCLKNGK